VYAFGSICYEMLAGVPPFPAAHAATLGRKLTEPAPSLRAIRETVPEELERIVLTCLARQPADRFSSGGEVVRALGGFAGSKS
jgi:serine/threonine-protein kinase